MIINVTPHELSEDQRRIGIVDLPKEMRLKLLQLFSFEKNS